MNKIILRIATAFAVGLMAVSAQAGIITASDVLIDTDIHDYYFSTTGTGLVTIDVIESILGDPPGGGNFDSEINLFFDDGFLDLSDFIENDDDGGFGLESMISIILNAGDYLLRIGTHGFGNSSGTDPVIIAATNPGGHHGWTDYDLTIQGDFVAEGPATVSEPGTLLLLSLGLLGFGFAKRKSQV